jgi:sortase A
MTRLEITKYLTIRTVGNFLLLFSLYGVGATFGPALYYEAQYQVIKYRGIHYTIEEPAQVTIAKTKEEKPTTSFGQVLSGAKDQILVPVDTQFSIVIPKIGATARILPNVDATNETEFMQALSVGVAHAKGTVFPGIKGTTYLFAHSTDNFWDVGRYNAVFYLLKDLKPGDDVTIFFENRRYDYTVTENKIGDAEDVSYITNARDTSEQLVMQTCWPPGTTWKRVYVTAVPKKV